MAVQPGPSAEFGDADLDHWQRRLRLVGVALPVATLVMLPLLWPSRWHAAAALAGALAVALFTRAMFAAIARGQARTVSLQQRVLDAERARAVVEERERIAREMHDSLAQTLAVNHLHLRALAADPEVPGPARDQLTELAELCQEAIRDVRENILGLRESSRCPDDLAAGLETFLTGWSRTSGVPARLEVTGAAPAVLPVGHAAQLSRVAQEALTNVRKHSRATSAVVTLRHDGHRTQLLVSDDGVGFDTHHPRPDAYGLHTMRERVEQLGGTLLVESLPGHGTRVLADVPTTVGS